MYPWEFSAIHVLTTIASVTVQSDESSYRSSSP